MIRLTAERFVIVLLSFVLLVLWSGSGVHQASSAAGLYGGTDTAENRIIKQAVARWISRAAGSDVWSAEGVQEAPPASLTLEDVRDGEALRYEDRRGAVYQFRIHGNTTVNIYYSVAGSMRSGDMHRCAQFNIVLRGAARLTTKDLVTGEESSHVYRANDYIVTPAGTPHLYEFLEDNYLLEWWDCPYRAWYYEPFRQRIRAQLEGGA